MGQQVYSAFDQQRLIARLVSLFGILSLLLAALGLYGVISHDSARRTSKIGVRMALDATRKSSFVMIERAAMILAAFGISSGIPLTLAAGRLSTRQFYGVNRMDPVIAIIATIALALVALLSPFFLLFAPV